MLIDEALTKGLVDAESSGSASTGLPEVLSVDEAAPTAPALDEDTIAQLVTWLHRVRDDYRRNIANTGRSSDVS